MLTATRHRWVLRKTVGMTNEADVRAICRLLTTPHTPLRVIDLRGANVESLKRSAALLALSQACNEIPASSLLEYVAFQHSPTALEFSRSRKRNAELQAANAAESLGKISVADIRANKITKLDLTGCSTADIVVCLSLLAQNTSVSELSLAACPLELFADAAIPSAQGEQTPQQALSRQLPLAAAFIQCLRNSALTSLDLSGISLRPLGYDTESKEKDKEKEKEKEASSLPAVVLQSVPAVYGSMSKLRHLELCQTEIVAAALGPLLREFILLESLDLGENALGAAGVRSLTPHLWSLPRLTKLQTHKCDLGLAGATELAKGLGQLTQLTHLNVACNNFLSAGISVLNAAFAKLTSLTTIDFAFNYCGQDQQPVDPSASPAKRPERRQWRPRQPRPDGSGHRPRRDRDKDKGKDKDRDRVKDKHRDKEKEKDTKSPVAVEGAADSPATPDSKSAPSTPHGPLERSVSTPKDAKDSQTPAHERKREHKRDDSAGGRRHWQGKPKQQPQRPRQSVMDSGGRRIAAKAIDLSFLTAMPKLTSLCASSKLLFAVFASLGLLSAVNILGVVGSQSLEAACAQLGSLTYLNLKGNDIGPEGSRHLAGGLKKLPKLVHLNLARNGLTGKGLAELSEAFGCLKALEFLDVSHNKLVRPDPATAARKPSALTATDSPAASIPDISASDSAADAKESKEPTTALADGVELESVFGGLASLSALQFLDLSCNDLADAGAIALSDSLAKISGLLCLLLRGSYCAWCCV